MKIAIVGTGISGLMAAHLLHREHEIEVFEAAARLGGHTHTHDIQLDGRRLAVDSGFIIYNETTYPHFSRLLAGLGVETQATDMSFSVSCERSGLEWGSRGLAGLFAQPGNALRPAFLRMLRDALRFNRASRDIGIDEKATLGEYLCGAGYSQAFVDHYLVPMGAAIWSAAPQQFLQTPVGAFVHFFRNHGLLDLRSDIRWRVVRGGSARYVERLTAPFVDRIRTRCPVSRVRRLADGVELGLPEGPRRFDRVVLAVHSDQALALLDDPSPLEREVLASIRTQCNDVVMHTDASLLPRRPAAHASWNYRVRADGEPSALVSYDMNRLQGLDTPQRVLVTLNGSDRVDPARVLRRLSYHHPILDARALAAQKLHAELDGARHTHYCGAWWGFGFHEDGVRSALAACASLREKSSCASLREKSSCASLREKSSCASLRGRR